MIMGQHSYFVSGNIQIILELCTFKKIIELVFEGSNELPADTNRGITGHLSCDHERCKLNLYQDLLD